MSVAQSGSPNILFIVLFDTLHPADGSRSRLKHVGVVNKQPYNRKCICWFFSIKLALIHGMEHIKFNKALRNAPNAPKKRWFVDVCQDRRAVRLVLQDGSPSDHRIIRDWTEQSTAQLS